MDQEKIREAVLLFLEGIGEDPSREGLAETPDRVARMCGELFYGLDLLQKQGEVSGPEAEIEKHLGKRFAASDNEMILEKDIPFYSVCEHHLLPFFGKAHIAYIPDGQVVGLSKLPRVLEVFARRPQIQEQLTAQTADAIMKHLQPKGVMVVLEAEHMCMSMRGIKKAGTQTVTCVKRGVFREDQAACDTFFKMIGK